MTSHLPLQKLVLAVTAGILLFVQISGLHRHLHLEAVGAMQVQASELYFGDAGLHQDQDHALHASDAAVGDHHSHGYFEVGALSDALTKLVIDLLPALLLASVLLVLPQRHIVRLPRPDSRTASLRLHPFALHPPSNGPPRLISQPF